MAAEMRPRPHWRTMKPICATVEVPSWRLMSVCTSIQAWPIRALRPPTTTMASMTAGRSKTTGAKRASRMPPAFTRPACMKPETGVGAVMEESSQR